jgi:hypothetical protein
MIGCRQNPFAAFSSSLFSQAMGSRSQNLPLPPSNASAATPPAQTFGFIPANLLNPIMRLVETNPAAELILLDEGSMVAPRTIMDTKDAGPQLGIETFGKEHLSTFAIIYSPVLAANWVMNPLLARSGFLNPEGMNPHAFIHMDNARAFAGLTQHVVAQAESKAENFLQHETPLTLRRHLSEQFLNQLDSLQHLPTPQGVTIPKSRVLQTQDETARQTLIDLLAQPYKHPVTGLPQANEAALKSSPPELSASSLPSLATQRRQAISQQQQNEKQFLQALEAQLKEHSPWAGLLQMKEARSPFKASTDSVEKAVQAPPEEARDWLLQFRRFLDTALDPALAKVYHPQQQGFRYEVPLKEGLAESGLSLSQHLQETLIGQKPLGLQAWLNPLPKSTEAWLPYLEKMKVFNSGVPLVLGAATGALLTVANVAWTACRNGGDLTFPRDKRPVPSPNTVGKSAQTHHSSLQGGVVA